ncbi:MAG: hypothetical protein COS98_00890 [Parcubacteria group bacterium CG07_land_8_20_14_0_80_35_11]|nr:MAG: hypothetical protein COS98_00890 [Parcubacteria group bacterium CG07_land_8_20_14_0_80_35_11]
MSLAQKIVITIIVVLLVVTLGGMILGKIGVGSLPTNGSRLGTTPQIGVTTPSTGKEVTNEVPATGTTETAGTKETATTRLVIKTGELNIVVKNVVESAKKIIQYAQKRGGWVVQSNIQEIEELPIATVVVRVPIEDFDEAITYIRGLATKVNYEKSEGQDVTEEYVDLESRLRNLEATEKQFLEIMKKAKTIEEILRVQGEISKIRGEIEQAKGRMLFLERSAKMATITVNLALSEELLPIPPAERWRPSYVAKRAWKSVVTFWKNVSYVAVTFFVYAVIWLPIVVIAYLIIWRIRKPKKEKK